LHRNVLSFENALEKNTKKPDKIGFAEH